MKRDLPHRRNARVQPTPAEKERNRRRRTSVSPFPPTPRGSFWVPTLAGIVSLLGGEHNSFVLGEDGFPRGKRVCGENEARTVQSAEFEERIDEGENGRISAGILVHSRDFGDEHADDVADVEENRGGMGCCDLEDGNHGEKMVLERRGGDECFEEMQQESEQNRGLGIVHREVKQGGKQKRQLGTQMTRDFRQVEQNLVVKRPRRVRRFVLIRRSTRDRGGGRGIAGEPRNSSRRTPGNPRSCGEKGEWRPSWTSSTR